MMHENWTLKVEIEHILLLIQVASLVLKADGEFTLTPSCWNLFPIILKKHFILKY